MSFGPKTDCAKDLQFVITGTVIEQKSEIPLLEVNLDNPFSFSRHVNNSFEKNVQSNSCSSEIRQPNVKFIVLPQLNHC